MIHMGHQASFSSKDKNKRIKVSSAAILYGSLSVNVNERNYFRCVSCLEFLRYEIFGA